MGMVMFVIVERGRSGTRQELSDSRAFLDKADKARPINYRTYPGMPLFPKFPLRTGIPLWIVSEVTFPAVHSKETDVSLPSTLGSFPFHDPQISQFP